MADHLAAGRHSAIRRRLLIAATFAPCGCTICAAAAKAAEQQRLRSAVMNRVLTAAMFEGNMDYEASIVPVKRYLYRALLRSLPPGTDEQAAQLLELGIGTGPNLQQYAGFYLWPSSSDASSSSNSQASSSGGGSGSSSVSAPGLHITGVDRNTVMRPYLEENLRHSGWPQEQLSRVEGQAEVLPLPDASMDAVVCTLVLCSVADVQSVLREVARVLKPGAACCSSRTHHGAGPAAAVADNCHLTWDLLPFIRAAPCSEGGDVEAGRFSMEKCASLNALQMASIAWHLA